MASSSSLLLLLGFISIADFAFSICVPVQNCINDLSDEDAQQRYDYILAKYEEADMKIFGKPIGLHGMTITHGSKREDHLVFHYVDNTVNDVIQTCTFVISESSNECMGIQLYCSGFLSRTPRPLFEVDPLTVCGNEVRVGIEKESDTKTEPEAEVVTESSRQTESSAETDSTKEPETTTLSKFRIFN